LFIENPSLNPDGSAKQGVVMKVLEEGKWKMPWSLEIVCKLDACSAKLLIEEADVKGVDYSGDDYAVCCPVCGSSIKIESSAVPLRVQRMANVGKKFRDSDW
jgi:hypothetical protein